VLLCAQFSGFPTLSEVRLPLAKVFSKWLPNGPGELLGLFLYPSNPFPADVGCFPQDDETMSPPFSRTHRAVFVARIVFLVTLLAGIVFVAARSNFTSRASDKTAITTTPSDKGRNTPTSKAYTSALKSSTLTPVCTTDPVVVNNSDSGAGSLRQAIADACDASTITFNMALVTSPISLTTAELSINKNLTITGPSSSLLTVQRSSAGGTPQFRIINIGSGTVSISGVTVTNGTPTASTPDGGGFVNSSTLTLTDVIVSGNTAGVGLPGGATGGGGGVGGGIYNGGTLIMTNCSVNGNTAGKGGAGSSAGGDGGKGGGLYNTASLTMTNCSVNGNNAGKGGTGGAKGGDGGWGGALYNRASLDMTNCVITGNNSGLGGDGGGPVNGGNGGGISTISGTTTLTGVTLSNNSAGDTGGTGGGGNGGAIDIVGTAEVSLTNSTVTANRSGTSAFGGPGFGGGISTQSALFVTGSTISNNTTGYVGGGIVTHNNLAVLKMTNSTVSGNNAPGSGGGIYDGGGSLTLTNSTITNNSFTGLSTEGTHTRLVRNSIIAGNGAGGDVEGTFTSQGNNVIGKSDGSNGFTNGTNGDQVGTVASPLNPRLGALANNGGPTQTHALLADSSAIDAGNNCVVNDSCSPSLGLSLTTDQRGAGFNRSVDGNGDGVATVDIGAYEVQSILVTNTNDSGPGSLRQAIMDANANADTNAINFQAGLTGTINLLSELPGLGTSMMINGPGANLLTVARSNAAATDFHIFNIFGGNIAIRGLTISGGNVGGAGISNSSTGTVSIINCAISGNNATPFGQPAGGIFSGSSGTLNVIGSTISGNSANTNCGGIAIDYGLTLNVTNSTISGNSAQGDAGGICVNTGTANITGSTVTNNRADSNGSNSFAHGGGISVSSGGTLNLRNTLVAGNFRGVSPGTADDISTITGVVNSTSSFNLIGTGGSGGLTNGVNNNQVGIANPGLGPLANNGGPTQTHPLLPSSPALNAGSNTLATNAGLTTDQRGLPRIANTTVDIGAFESRGFTIAATGGTPQSAPITTAFGSPLLATVSSAFGEPVAGGVVIFTAPSSGASGTFTGNLLTANAAINASGVATAPAFTANGIIGGPYNVVASLAGGSPSANFSLTNLKGNQTITVNTHAPANATYNSQFTVAATASSGLAVSYSSSGSCTNVGANFTMTSGTGTCTVMYNQAGDTNYNAATQVTESVTAQKANQTITFGGLSGKTLGDPDFSVSATASSSLSVSFAASGQCTVTGTNVHITGAGSCTITAKQAGDSNYNAAPDVPQLFNIAKAATTTGVSSSVNPSEFGQSVTFTATVTSGAGTPTGTVQFKDGGVSIGSAQTLNAGGVAQLTTSALTAGTHIITADYNGDANFLLSSGTLSGGQVVKAQPALSINDVSMAEGNSGTTNFVFTVTLSAASNLTVNVDYATANGTATLADNDYQAVSGTLTFNPGNLTRTITVVVNGDQKFEPDETVFVNLTNAVNATISDSQGLGTIQNDDTLQLILEESGPDPNQAAAFDSMLFVRDPFHVQSVASWLDLGPDRNTRVLVFVKNLQLNQGETASAVTVNLVDFNSQSYDVAAENVQVLPTPGFTQVTFRLPNNLAAGTCMVTVKAHGQISNTGTIRIVP
jgi:hypothetical protein